jgi:hypothetical protein
MGTKQFRQLFIFFFNIKVTTNRYYSAQLLDKSWILDRIWIRFCNRHTCVIGTRVFHRSGKRGEREAAGISTNCFVIGGSMIFTYLSAAVDPNSTTRIAAQLVTGIGFLGAGIILKGELDRKITNLTTAASIWFSAAIGMAIGFNF